ncbi:hypothetical protein GI374_16410 [Paracoccus sp. S-4012]|uniref:hypothetical protein n=1 Tax=Paracoccus sp. S-4012 TaxID=2665648 RepID=UPI00132A74BD|nr:hypothetical protein [Paracoccus sp. S-4012]MRX51972.1 hypothetical protein [Paracoccus sp. S-4012]
MTRELSAGRATVRRGLGVLQAALNHAHAQGLVIHPIAVTLPQAGAPRERWLTWSEVARLIRHPEPPVRRFIVLSIYTGRRASTILDLIWPRVDLKAGLIRFRAEEQAEQAAGGISIPRQ